MYNAPKKRATSISKVENTQKWQKRQQTKNSKNYYWLANKNEK